MPRRKNDPPPETVEPERFFDSALDMRIEDLPERVTPNSVTKNGKAVGRPSGLTRNFLRDKLPQIIDDLRIGMPFEQSCYRVGLLPRTAQYWVERGLYDDADPLHAYFALSVKQARAEFLRRSIGRLQLTRSGRKTDGEGPWTIDAWLLERSFPYDFGQRRVVHGTGTDGAIPFEILDPNRRVPE